MPALVSHRRPLAVLATATSRSLAQEVGPLRPDYAGPTGAQTIVQHALGAAGIPCVGLWVQVPQYVAGSPSPPAVRALLARLAELHRLDLHLQALDARGRRVPATASRKGSRPDPTSRRSSTASTARHRAPTGDELVDEIERFLRSQSEE